jgi:tetratricopeptide (TPR) repeat protein
MNATTPQTRGNWARRGLANEGEINRDTQAMLLRQLYLSHYTQRQFELAYGIALQATELGVLPDVVQQDCARAKQALGDIDGAASHLRLAARLGPASRRAFHYWTLGSVLHLAGRHEEAVSALNRAVRWGTTDKPLYRAHVALAKLATGKRIRGGSQLIAVLDACPAGQGYGRFVLGELAFRLNLMDEARRFLGAFIKRTRKGQVAIRVALEPELATAEATLRSLDSDTP